MKKGNFNEGRMAEQAYLAILVALKMVNVMVRIG